MFTTNEPVPTEPLLEECLRLKQDIAQIKEQLALYKKKLSVLEDERSEALKRNWEERLGPVHMMQVVDEFIDRKWEVSERIEEAKVVLEEKREEIWVRRRLGGCEGYEEYEGSEEEDGDEEEDEEEDEYEEEEEEEEGDGDDVRWKYDTLDWRMALELALSIGRI